MDPPGTTSIISIDGGAETAAHDVDARLAGHVAAYWTLVVTRPPSRVRVIPDGRVDIVFDLDTAEAHVGGVIADPFEVVHERPTRFLGVTFLPGAASPLLGASIGDLAIGWCPLSSLLGPVADALAAELRDTDGVTRRIALLETFLLARLGCADARVDRAVQAIHETGGRVAIDELGRRTGTSPRNLARLFHDYVGMPPKRFARIVRAQSALRRLAESPPPELGALAVELGFADQAHMTREVRAVAGAAPGALSDAFKRRGSPR